MPLTRWTSVVSLLIGFSIPAGSASASLNTLHPFVGVDFQERTLQCENNFGGNLFQAHAFQYDLYTGIRFYYYWGIDIGYFANKNKNRTTEFGPSATVSGQTLSATAPTETHYTEIKIKGPHINFLGFYPLMPLYGIEMIGGIGVAYNKLMLKDAIVALSDVSLTSPISRTYDIKKANARALLGLQTLLYSSVGIRATVTWENTSVFNNLKPTEFPNDVRSVNAKNSWAYGLGLFAII